MFRTPVIIGASGTSGTSSFGSSGTSGNLPLVGVDHGILFRETGATYGYDNNSGFTFDNSVGYLKIGNISSGTTRIHIYGENTSPYIDETYISPDSAIMIDGSRSSDKSLIIC